MAQRTEKEETRENLIEMWDQQGNIVMWTEAEQGVDVGEKQMEAIQERQQMTENMGGQGQ